MKNISFLFLTLAYVFFIGCKEGTNNSNINDNTEQEVVKIGAILPLTGEMASYGESLKKGMDLAIENINNSGGIDTKKVEIVYEDGQGLPKNSVNAFNKLLNSDKVPLIIGGMFSAPTLSIAPIAEKEKIVLLSPTASSIDLTNSGDYIFRIYPSDIYDGIFLANFTVDSLSVSKISIIYENVASITAISKVFKKTIEDKDGEIVAYEGYNSNNIDFHSILSKIKNDNSELIFFPGNLNSMSKILIQAKELNITKKFLTISTFYDNKIIELAGNATEDVLFSTPMFNISDSTAQMKTFINLYLSKYNIEPDILGGYGFDVVNIASLAIKNKGYTSEKIKQGLYEIKNFNGVTGNTTFDKNGDVDKELKMMTVKNSSFIVY